MAALNALSGIRVVRATAEDLNRINLAAAERPPGRTFTKHHPAMGGDRGYIDKWSPYGKTRVLLDQIDGVLDTYAPDQLTIRQIYYRLIASPRPSGASAA